MISAWMLDFEASFGYSYMGTVYNQNQGPYCLLRADNHVWRRKIDIKLGLSLCNFQMKMTICILTGWSKGS